MSQFAPEDSQGSIDLVSNGDITFEADRNQDGAGDLVFRTAGVERARIKHDGSGTGWSNVLGGSSSVWLRPSQKLPPRPQPKWITEFQSGHGWTATTNGGTANLNDTTAYLFGSQGVTLTTPGTASGVVIKNFAITSLDLSASTTIVWLKIDDITHLKTFDIYWGDTSLTNFYYSQYLDGTLSDGPPLRSGEWVGIRIPRDNLTTTGTPNWATITAMQLRFFDDNTGHPVTVHVGGISYIPDQTAFPNGVVSIGFDDSYISTYTQGRLKLDQYGYPATVYNIIDYVDSDAGVNFLTSAQLTELQNQHGWEIAAHAFTHADHDTNFVNLTEAQVDSDAWQMKKWLVDNGYRGHNHFAYPGGAWNLTTEDALKRYYTTLRLLNNTPRQALPPAMPGGVVRLNAFEVLNTTTTAAVTSLIDGAYSGKDWLILVFHKIVSSPASSIEYSIANFGTIVDYLNTKGIPVKTIGDVLSSL